MVISTFTENFPRIGPRFQIIYIFKSNKIFAHSQSETYRHTDGQTRQIKNHFSGVLVLIKADVLNSTSEPESVLNSTSSFMWYSIRSTSMEIKRLQLREKL